MQRFLYDDNVGLPACTLVCNEWRHWKPHHMHNACAQHTCHTTKYIEANQRCNLIGCLSWGMRSIVTLGEWLTVYSHNSWSTENDVVTQGNEVQNNFLPVECWALYIPADQSVPWSFW